MRYHNRLATAILLIHLTSASALAAPEPEQLRRGLVATYRDTSKPNPVVVTRLEPTVALALGPKESAHPRLTPGGDVVWKGHINIVRNGT